MDAPAEATTKDVTAASKSNNDKNATTRSGKRRSKNTPAETAVRSKDELAPSLPSVPSTQHLHPHGMVV